METQTQKLIDQCHAESLTLCKLGKSRSPTVTLLDELAAELRRLAANQLPEWASITPATDEPRAAQIVEGWASRWPGSVHAPRMALAASWIKQRDQEIATLRGQLSQAMPFAAYAELSARLNPAEPAFSEPRPAAFGEFHDARVKCDSEPARREPYAGEQPKSGALYSDSPTPTLESLQSDIAALINTLRDDLNAVHRQGLERVQHDRAMLEQATRAADAQALAALLEYRRQWIKWTKQTDSEHFPAHAALVAVTDRVTGSLPK